jgi:hypothetical protein
LTNDKLRKELIKDRESFIVYKGQENKDYEMWDELQRDASDSSAQKVPKKTAGKTQKTNKKVKSLDEDRENVFKAFM